jgi:hypothetical protein
MESELFIKKGHNTTLIISFGGCQSGMGGLALFEFKNFLEKHFSDYDRLFYIDKHKDWYQKGIEGISRNVDETVSHIKTKINGYKRVICIGSSAGGYAAILFGSLLNVDIVITFNAQTFLKRPRYTTNLRTVINTKTVYHLYGDISIKNDDPLHHISHCENLEGPRNVFIYRRQSCNMKDLRDSGILLDIFHAILQTYG